MHNLDKWLVCNRKGKSYLLARDDHAYYAIEVGKRLDEATEEWLYQQGVSEKILQELLLTYQTFPKASLRGVAIGGNMSGCAVSFYPKSERRCDYILELDYSPDFLELFFENIPRFLGPQKVSTNADEDWRKKEQDPELLRKLRFVPATCLAAGVCGGIGFIRTGHWTWFTLCLLCLFTELCLPVVMPAYFTLALPKGNKKKNAWELEFPLTVLLLLLVFHGRVNWLSDADFWITVAVGGIAGLLLYPYYPDLRKVKGAIALAILVGAGISMIVGGYANQVYDFAEPDSYVLEVENLYKSGGKRQDYRCTVTLPDGREVSLSISQSLYKTLEIGDEVLVERGDGAFGMEYANVHSAQ